MTGVVWLLVGLIAAWLFIAYAIFTLRARQLKESAKFSAEFFEYANQLVEDDETPDLVISYLEKMAVVINRPEFSRYLLKFALTGKLRATTNNPTTKSRQLTSAVRGMREEFQVMVARATVACMMSATYKSPLFGVILRRVTLFSIERDKEQAEIVGSNLFSNGFGNGHAHA